MHDTKAAFGTLRSPQTDAGVDIESGSLGSSETSEGSYALVPCG